MKFRLIAATLFVGAAAMGLVGCSQDSAPDNVVAPGTDTPVVEQNWWHGGGGGGGCYNNSQTAYANGCDDATCFRDIQQQGGCGGHFRRWGWSNGPLAQGSYVFDLYAGAGQCATTHGTLVGQLLVNYTGSTATIEYRTCGTYKMTEEHLYVGSDILPRDRWGRYTVAPGRYPFHGYNTAGVQSKVFTVNGLSGQIYIVAHAKVIGDFTQGDCGVRGCPSPCDAGFHPEVLDLALPTTPVTLQVHFQGNVPLFGQNDAYLQGNLSGAGIFDSPAGVFNVPTFCIDIDHDIDSNPAPVTMISSYSPDAALLACSLDHPENLDVVNWILNQDRTQWGADQRDIQAAMWALTDNGFTYCGGANDACTRGGITFSKSRVQAIVAEALAEGEGFYPPCDGVVAVILHPGGCGPDVQRQIVLSTVPVITVPGLCTVCE
ncbi:MAG: hypothetical protein U0527_10150 [Candidatus Eisenbacteria bacterium]